MVRLIGVCHYMHTWVIHRILELGNLFLDVADMNIKFGDFS